MRPDNSSPSCWSTQSTCHPFTSETSVVDNARVIFDALSQLKTPMMGPFFGCAGELFALIPSAAAAIRYLDHESRKNEQTQQDDPSLTTNLRHRGINPQRVAIAGVSTGGNLTLASMFVARESGDPLPACAVPISPWIDLEHESESMMTMDELEPMCHKAVLDKCADIYLPLGDKTSPLLSALDGDLTGLPPLFGPIGIYETLLDDARALALKAKEANVPVELKIYDRQFHVFQIFSQGFGYGYIIGFGALFAIGMCGLTCVSQGGAGASVQILLFSVAAIELKRKAPNTHTLLEFVRTRYGAAAHCVLGFYSLFFMGINLLVGGSAVFATLTD
ncbi:hypothetical protein FOPE_03656 [Fonsecaea pedrosoi]|nr:hypothetical protein FOPE_03656 [Fonsecaea pedrosoi]